VPSPDVSAIFPFSSVHCPGRLPKNNDVDRASIPPGFRVTMKPYTFLRPLSIDLMRHDVSILFLILARLKEMTGSSP
jgi:hypothetical protein